VTSIFCAIELHLLTYLLLGNSRSFTLVPSDRPHMIYH